MDRPTERGEILDRSAARARRSRCSARPTPARAPRCAAASPPSPATSSSSRTPTSSTRRKNIRSSSISSCKGSADVVYGSRFLGRHRVFLFTHYLGNRLVTLATNVLYNTMLTDMETCYKVMRVDVLRSMTLRVERLRHRAGDHGEDLQARLPRLRSADHLRRAAATTKARRSRGPPGSSRSGCC